MIKQRFKMGKDLSCLLNRFWEECISYFTHDKGVKRILKILFLAMLFIIIDWENYLNKPWYVLMLPPIGFILCALFNIALDMQKELNQNKAVIDIRMAKNQLTNDLIAIIEECDQGLVGGEELLKKTLKLMEESKVCSKATLYSTEHYRLTYPVGTFPPHPDKAIPAMLKMFIHRNLLHTLEW